MLVKQGNDLFFGKQRFLITHLEFTDVCNCHCSYCIEGNGNRNRMNDAFSDETKMVKLIEKIYRKIQPEDFMLFIIAGGEPTLQPSLKSVITKIQSRKNVAIIITTNFTQSAEFYKDLNIPLIVSLHLEDNNIDQFLEKLEKCYELIAHVRIMACPELFDEFKIACLKMGTLHKRLPLNIATEKIVPGPNYIPNYSREYLDFLVKWRMRTVIDYPESLNTKLGIAKGFFHFPEWWVLTEGKLTMIPDYTASFIGMYCERNFISIEKTGKLWLSWCCDSGLNVFDLDELPSNLFENVICKKTSCPMSFLAALPKYKSIEYAPEYLKKKGR